MASLDVLLLAQTGLQTLFEPISAQSTGVGDDTMNHIDLDFPECSQDVMLAIDGEGRKGFLPAQA